MQVRITASALIGIFVLGVHCQSGFGQQKPIIEYSSLLSSLTVSPTEHELDFRSELIGVFLPPAVEITAVLTKPSETTPLHSQSFRSRALVSPFTRLTATGSKKFTFEQAGDYQVTFYANRTPMTQVRFSVVTVKTPRPAESAGLFLPSGPWEQWGYAWFPRGNGRKATRKSDCGGIIWGAMTIPKTRHMKLKSKKTEKSSPKAVRSR